MAIRRFSIHEASEKTIENNTLVDISQFIHSHLHRQVTIISPTQPQEKDLGFDDIIEGLPPGITLALQFKRPYPYNSARLSNFAKFTIDTFQLQTLLNHFNPEEAYFVFVPFPTTDEIIRNRSNLLNIGVAVDVHDVPNARKITQHTRTVRVAKSSLFPLVTIADPRIFEDTKSKSLKQWCNSLENADSFNVVEHKKDKKRKPSKLKNMYYLHISEERSPDSHLGIIRIS